MNARPVHELRAPIRDHVLRSVADRLAYLPPAVRDKLDVYARGKGLSRAEALLELSVEALGA